MAAKDAVEKIVITRLESERARMRKNTDRGTDVALTLPPRSKLRHGDVVALSDSTMIMIEIEQEKVGVVRVRDARLAALVGHAIGNLHPADKGGRRQDLFSHPVRRRGFDGQEAAGASWRSGRDNGRHRV
jgi:urease accessory protein UreE